MAVPNQNLLQEDAMRYKRAGYTHWIQWYTYDLFLGMDVYHAFPTTADAVDLHRTSLQDKGHSVIVREL